MSIEPGQFPNLVTAWRMRDWLAPSGVDYFKDHPLVLPQYPTDDLRWDFSQLRVRLPADPVEEPMTPVEEMLGPLLKLCQRHQGKVPAGLWVYEWFYFELLARDENVQPLCWISPKLLYEHHFEGLDEEAALAAAHGKYPRRLITMDTLATTPPDGTERDLLERDQWRQWLQTTWHANEAAWRKRRLLGYKTVEPWTTQLAFDGNSTWGDLEPGPTDRGSDVSRSEWRRRADADYPGFYWKMVPLYDRRDLSRVWQTMQRETFVTSVFNPEARADQERNLWRALEKRFALRYQRMTLRRHWIRVRMEHVLNRSREGMILADMADELIREGLHPLPQGDVRRPAPTEHWGMLTDGARRTVVRIRRSLRDRGKIEGRKRGRPRKDKVT